MSNFLSFFYILVISPLSDVGLVEIFSHSVGCLFDSSNVSFASQKLLRFRRSHVFIVAVTVCAPGVYLGSGLLYTCMEGYSALSRLSASMLLDLTLIHLDLSFVHGLDMNIFPFFYMLTSCYVTTLC